MKNTKGGQAEGAALASFLHEQSGDPRDDSDDLADDIEEMLDEVQARIGRELTDQERDDFTDEYLKQLDDEEDESEIIENWCNQYGGDTCKDGGKGGDGGKVRVPKERKERVKKEVKEKVKAKREKAPKGDRTVTKVKEAIGGKEDKKTKFDFSKAVEELKTEREVSKTKDTEEKGKRGVFRKAWDFITGNAEGDELEQLLSAAVDVMEEKLGRELTDEEMDELTDELVEDE